jgi:integrase
MALVDIEGLHVVRSKGRTYVYAWRGGPRIHAELGTDAFLEALAEARASRPSRDPSKFRGLVADYKDDDAWKNLSDKTKSNWTPFIDSAVEHFDALRVAAFDRPLIRVLIKAWRDRWKHSPRQADMALQALSRVLSFGVDAGRLQNNACSGIKRLYSSDRSEIIWTDADITALTAVASREIAWAVRLAAETGLRKGDLLRLSWGHVKANSIEIRTGKSGDRKTAIIPLHAGIRQLLAEIPRRATTILTTTAGHSWKTGFNASFIKAKKTAGVDKHFHDLRGTAATRFFLAGLQVREIAEIFTWSEDQVDRLISVYVKKDELLRDRIRRIDEAEARTSAVKPAVKLDR